MPQPSRRPGLPTMLFLGELANIGVSNIPPVTLSLIAVQFLIYFGLLDDFHNFNPRNVCIGFDTTWTNAQFWRLFIGALVHLDEWHLYFNMASLLWKGTRLEGRKFSSSYYFCLILAFIPLCGLTTILLDYALAELVNDYGRLHTCAAGFSAVLFALKVLASHYDDAHTVYVMGSFPVNSRYACWAELVAIQLVTPNASFTGHLAGILVGLLYIYKPLKSAIDAIYFGIVAPILGVGGGSSRRQNRPQYVDTSEWRWSNLIWGTNNGANHSNNWGAGSATGYRATSPNRNAYQGASAPTSPSSPYSQFTAGLSEDDQLAWALHESASVETPNRRQWAGTAGDRATPPRYGWNVGS